MTLILILIINSILNKTVACSTIMPLIKKQRRGWKKGVTKKRGANIAPAREEEKTENVIRNYMTLIVESMV